MRDAIFLSAGVPDPLRGPDYAATADTAAITAAVSALIHVVLGRRPLVWGGQPAITPMVLVTAEALEINYGEWVRLYQSRFFEDEFPEDNDRFNNVTFTDFTPRDREASLRHMRERMFSEHRFAAAVFVGGMGGIVEEFELFQRLQPHALVLPVPSTGGASLEVGSRLDAIPSDLMQDRDYVGLFHRHLAISPRERRFDRPADQPIAIENRYWRPGDKS